MNRWLETLLISAGLSFVMTYAFTRYMLRNRIYVGRRTWDSQQKLIMTLLEENMRVNDALRRPDGMAYFDAFNDPEAAP